MVIINKDATLEYFKAPSAEELEDWCRENRYSGVFATRNETDHVLAAALWHAHQHFSDSKPLDICSYAGLVSYLATGWYGGFGTEEYEKERRAEHIVMALAGCYGEGGLYLAPERVIEGEIATPEFSQMILEFLDEFYFEDAQRAILNLIDNVDEELVAKLILNLTSVPEEYKTVVHTAKEFLQGKAKPKDLREAIRRVVPKVAPQRTTARKEPLYRPTNG